MSPGAFVFPAGGFRSSVVGSGTPAILSVRAMYALQAAAFRGCCVAEYRHRGGCVGGSWAGRGMIFSTSWGGGVSFPVVVVTLLAERILDPYLSILWKVLRCGSVDLRIPPVGRGVSWMGAVCMVEPCGDLQWRHQRFHSFHPYLKVAWRVCSDDV